jgi:fumarylacetoacetase
VTAAGDGDRAVRRSRARAELAPTLDPSRRSWLPSANAPDADFPLQNLPFCVFSRGPGPARPGVAIGDALVDLAALHASGMLDGLAAAEACATSTLNALMALGRAPARALRGRLSAWLGADHPDDDVRARVAAALVPQAAVTFHLPATVGDYTDFYASVHHATNVGRLFRPDQPLLPNYKWVPIGYHGRASSVVVSGTPVHRPAGQRKGPQDAVPVVGPSRSLDYELEVAAWVGAGNPLGQPVPLADADEHLFGLSLLNDWSARDLQAWEYQPLGPFLAKNFASSVSPFVVTLDALEPFRAPVAARAVDDPAPLPYLADPEDAARGGIALTLEVWLRTARMRREGVPAVRLSQGSFLDLYWSLGQMLTHHASNGCNLRPGDLLGSGTVSGPTAGSRGCLLELTRRGAEPVPLPTGETRGFLEDGDEVVLTGFAEAAGAVRIGLGRCVGRVGAG